MSTLLLLHRLKYSFVFYLTDSINNLCGFGFHGYNERGQPKWDLVTNVFPMKVEFASNPRDVMINWNVCAAIWLRRLDTTNPPTHTHTHTHFTHSTQGVL